MYNFTGSSELLLNLCVVVIGTLILELFYPTIKVKWLQSIFMPTIVTSEMLLCMSLPFTEVGGFTFDLRAVPMIIGPLYGGVSTAITMLLIYLSYRTALGGPQVWTGLTLGFVLIVGTWFLSRFYNRKPRGQKMLVGSIPMLLLLTVLDGIIYNHLKNHPHLNVTLVMFDVVNLIVFWITVLAVEYVHENGRLIEEVHRADKLNVLGELAASIAHEIRNPLTVSKGFVQLTKESDGLPTEQEEHLDFAIREMDRAHEIINDYLSLARPETDVCQKVSLEHEVQHVLEMLTPYANLRNVIIQSDLRRDLDVYGDPQKVTRTFVNIIKNAIESMPGGGDLIVSSNRVKTFALVQVVDTGIGMTAATICRLGEPFYSTKHSGTGLGLMTSYRYCQSMGGKIKVTSAVGKGTTFEVFLPLHAPICKKRC